MMRTFHISDPELLQAADGELSSRRAAEIQSHLASCWKCRARRAEIESTIVEFVRGHEAAGNADLPPIGQARARLEAGLAELAASHSNQTRFPWRRLAYAGFGGLALVAVYFFAVHMGTTPVHAAQTPDTRLTPGATRQVTRDDICAPGTTDKIQSVPTDLAHLVFKTYGIQNPQPRTFEVDYLITPALGGSGDIQNLWPQPYSAGVWNAHVKDALEDRMRTLVCEGKLELETAQHDIAKDWIAAYKKYFKTSSPLEIHAGFAIDPPWE